MPESDDRRDATGGLLARLAGGDPAALGELYDALGSTLYSPALWLVGDVADAEDAVQAAFLSVTSLGARLPAIRHPAAYLHRVVRREALRLRGRERARPTVPLDGLVFEPLAAADAMSPGERVDIERRVAELSLRQREVLYLHVYGGLTFREVGEVQGVSTHTAASRYKLAIAHLRKELNPT